jgi:general secretion pathway protein K
MMMIGSSSSDVPTARDGFIVVAVLWILTALATLAAIYAIYVANTATALAVNDDAVQAEALVSAGVELTAYQLVVANKETRPTHGRLIFRMGRARVVVDFRAETARIDLNAASKELLAGLFGVLGAQEDDADQYAERIIGWRTTPGRASQDSEASLYRTAGMTYGPRGAPFAHVEELWLVLGLPPPLVERMLPDVTVFSGRAEVNALVASPEVVAALPGMSPERLNAVLAARTTGPSSEQSTPTAPAVAQPGTTSDGSDATRVAVRIDFDNGRRLASEVVILVRDGGDEPFQVLSWRDDVDVPRAERMLKVELRR